MVEYISYRCRKCGLPFIIPEDGLRLAAVTGNYFACPLCHGGIKEIGPYEDFGECIDNARVYKRVNGRIKQNG